MKFLIQILIIQLCLLCLRASPVLFDSEISLAKNVRAGSCSAAFITCPSTRVGTCAATSTTSFICPARQVTGNDDFLYQNLKDQGGDREFFPPVPTTSTELNDVQSLGVSYGLTYNALHPRLQGSRSYTPIVPPGWDELPERERGHLWAKDMGGSGGYYLNIITLAQTANRLMNNDFECKVKEALELMDLDKLSRVFVTILVRYNPDVNLSKKIFLFADVEYLTSAGWVMEPWLGMAIKNRQDETTERLFSDRTSTIKSASVKSTDDSSCVSQSTTINTVGFYPQMSLTNDWWYLFRQIGAPSVKTEYGELLFDASEQTEDFTSAHITSRQSYAINRGMAFRFQVSPYSLASGVMTFSITGGIILRFHLGQAATWNTIGPDGYDVLATSAMTIGPGWWDIQVVYTGGDIVLFERGVKMFTITRQIPTTLLFRATFLNANAGTNTIFKFSNVAVHQNLF